MNGGSASWNTANNNFNQTLKSVSVIDTDGDGFADFGSAVIAVIFDHNMNTTTLDTAINLHSVVVLSNNDIWAVGDNDACLHYNGTGWVVFNDGLTTNNLYSAAKTSYKKSPFSPFSALHDVIK